MLPFPKRTANDDVVELTDEDLVPVDEIAPPAAARLSQSPAHPASRSRITRASALPPGSRRVLDEQIEEDVAGQCLASIAIATRASSPRRLSSSSHIRASLAAAPVPAPPIASPEWRAPESPASARLPSVSPPPFVRTTPPSSWPRAHAPEAPGIRDSVAPAAFVRRSSPELARPASIGSVAPVSMSSLPSAQASAEPTVILLRERPRSIWILAAAALGALGAVAAMRFAPAAVSHETVAGAAAQAPSPPAPVLSLPSTAVVPPIASSVPAAPAVMMFTDEQGVAIKSIPAPAAPAVGAAAPRKSVTPATAAAPPAPRPAQAPRAPSMGPALPDGSFGLGRSDTTTASSPPSLTAAAPAPEPPRKRALTPEQQLAEAQLKASMK